MRFDAGKIGEVILNGIQTSNGKEFEIRLSVLPDEDAHEIRYFQKIKKREHSQIGIMVPYYLQYNGEKVTDEVLAKYTGYFHPNIVGVREHIDIIRQVADDYGIQFEKKVQDSSPIGYIIRHPPDILVVNPQGQLLESRIMPEHGADEIAVFVRQLLGTDG